jgi:hypothetical protein
MRDKGASMRNYAVELPFSLEHDLKMAGWNGVISPYPDMSLEQKAMQSIRNSLLKKFSDETPPSANANALTLFLSINEKCKDFSLGASSCTNIEAIALGEAKDFIYRMFLPNDQSQGNLRRLTLAEISSRLGVGNGANIGAFSTDFLSKVGTSLMTATDRRLHLLYVQAISCDPLWSSVESTRSKFRETDLAPGSRLSFVPKTTEISRTICTEPLLNMLFQKGIASVLEDLLGETCNISLSKQPNWNRSLAQLGSTSGKFGTIDLSSASDSMSTSLVTEFFPTHVLNMLELARSPCTILPDGTSVELHMISSMGNAFTFPLQTIFFASLVYGAYKALGYPFLKPNRHSSGNFAVFGDDIICLRQAYGLVCRLLSICGFDVNVGKSFNQGFFRESCGHDYFHGRNVRGVYIKTLRTEGDRYSAINRLNRWSATWNIPLPSTIHCLLRGQRFLPIPMDEMDDSGVKVPSSFPFKKRYNRYTGGVIYRFLYRLPTSYSVTDVLEKPPKIRGWINNPDAVLLAALAGTLRSGKVVVRSNEHNRAQLRTRSSSSWDWIPPDYAEMHRFYGDSWKAIFELNLTFFKV